MLLRMDVLARIVAGEIDVVYRLWRKPTVKAGGRLRTAMGELAIDAVEEIDPASITDADAARAGFASADEARASLEPRPVRTRAGNPVAGRGRTAKPDETSRPYRVLVHFAGADTRAVLHDDASAEAVAAVIAKLDAMDARSARGPWTRRTLALIGQWPGRRAPELAEMEGLATPVFKTDVRKLKELGLTISLTVGYTLSPRGEAVLRAAS
jgi:hypothetical protein